MNKFTTPSTNNSNNRCRNIALYLALFMISQAKVCGPWSFNRPTPSCLSSVQGIQEEISDRTDISIPKRGVYLLHDAVETGNLDIVNILIDRINEDVKSHQGDDPCYRDEDFPNTFHPDSLCTPLGKAIEMGNLEIVKALGSLESKLLKSKSSKSKFKPLIDINAARKKGPTSLLLALERKAPIEIKIPEYLLSFDRIDITTEHITKQVTPLHIMATDERCQQLIETLLNKLLTGKHKYNSSKVSKHSNSTLSNSDLCKRTLLSRNKNDCTALHIAALYNNRQAFRLIFKTIEQVCPDDIYAFLFPQSNDQKGSVQRSNKKKKKSLFYLAYLPKPSASYHFFTLLGFVTFINRLLFGSEDRFYKSSNSNMFEFVLKTVGGYLKPQHWDKILEEIDLWLAESPREIEETEKIKERTRKKLNYANKLRSIVNEVRSHLPNTINDPNIESKNISHKVDVSSSSNKNSKNT